MAYCSGEWFEEWFESPYYDLLYASRNEQEAAFFIDNLLKYLSLPPNTTILDLACGKGRHSVYLNKKGFKVTGTDLSARSITYASKFTNSGLSFFIQDMRKPLLEKFDLVLNLFTSFGYFEDDAENFKVLVSVNSMLKNNGVFILDFLNGSKIPADLNFRENRKEGDTEFNIHKRTENGFVIKDIDVITGSENKKYSEKVRLYKHTDLWKMFEKAGLKVESLFGDYSLGAFDVNQSDRMIFITKKN